MTDHIKVREMQVIHFSVEKEDQEKKWDGEPAKMVTVILIYALGEDGVVYEFAGGRGWTAYPIPPNTKPVQMNLPPVIPRRQP